jgi:transcriptional regulator with XRE-family HTH domain
MRQALVRADVGAMVAILRAATGLSQIEFANLMGDGWSQTMVSDIERRKRGTLYDIRELRRFADTLDMPRSALLPLVIGDPSATLKADEPCPTGALDVDRRSFTTLTASLAAGAALPPIHVPTRIDQAHVRYLWASLERLNRREQVNGGGAIAHEAIRLFSRAKTMLDDSDYSEQVGRQLLAVTAEIANAAGWATYDQDDHTLARQLYSSATLLADNSGIPEVAVHLYSNLAHQSADLARNTGRRGLAREALLYANRAAEAARHEHSPKLHTLAALRQAHAYAELGDEHGFRSAIVTARRELDRGEHPTDPQWASYVTDSEITSFEARGYSALARVQGERDDRVSTLYRTVLDDSALCPRDQAGFRALLAQTLLANGDHTQAISEGMALLPDLGQRVISTRALNRLRPVRTAAEKTGEEEFCARFDASARALGTTSPDQTRLR